MDINQVVSWIKALLEAVDFVHTFRVMSGEPLLQKQLPELLKILFTFPKINHIQLVSNATLNPSPELTALLKGRRNASIFFSNYGPEVAPHYQEILDYCLKEGILVQTKPQSVKWMDYGDFHQRTNDPAVKEAIFRRCPNNCRHISDIEQ